MCILKSYFQGPVDKLCICYIINLCVKKTLINQNVYTSADVNINVNDSMAGM